MALEVFMALSKMPNPLQMRSPKAVGIVKGQSFG